MRKTKVQISRAIMQAHDKGLYRCLVNVISIVLNLIFQVYLASVGTQPGSCRSWSQKVMAGFLAMRPVSCSKLFKTEV